MHMAPRAAAWVAWAVWTCNTQYRERKFAMSGRCLGKSGLRPALFVFMAGEEGDLVSSSCDLLTSRHDPSTAQPEKASGCSGRDDGFVVVA